MFDGGVLINVLGRLQVSNPTSFLLTIRLESLLVEHGKLIQSLSPIVLTFVVVIVPVDVFHSWVSSKRVTD